MMPTNLFSVSLKQKEQEIWWKGKVLPLLYDTDVLILGGGFSGLSAAVNFATGGKKVSLLDSKTFLGDELTSYLDGSLDPEDISNPEPVEVCKKYSMIRNGHSYVKNDDVKREMEIMLEKHKIPFLYNTYPVHITSDGTKYLTIVANKSGFQCVRAETIIDCTQASITRYLMNDSDSIRFGENVTIIVEMYGANRTESGYLQLPGFLKLNDNRIRITPGYLSGGHLFFHFTCRLPETAGRTDIRKLNNATAEMQMKAYEVVKYLVNNESRFTNATYSRLSYNIKHEYIREKRDIPSWADNSQFNTCFTIRDMTFRLNDFAGKYPGIWILPARRFDYSATISANVGDKLSKTLLENGIPELTLKHKNKTGNEDCVFNITYNDPGYVGKEYGQIKINPFVIPLLEEYQVIVAGGGTSGATAGAVAGKEGLKTIIVDGNNGLGGTGTFGGVHSYWRGKRNGFTREIDDNVSKAEQDIKHRRDSEIIWNIEVKNYILVRNVKASKAELIFHSLAAGVIMKGNQVKGLVLATPYGTFAVTSQLLIDATGDADVAAFAGAEYVYGSATNVFPMYYSLGWSRKPGSYSTKFESMVDTRDILDLHRALVANRRADQKKSLCDHATYLTTRESRHIKGDITITLTDQLTHKQWPDVVNIHFSNNDIKGHHSSDWFRIGLIPPNLEVEIPLRALIPKGLENILVVGKAFSVKHDAYPTVRMQSDLQNLGGVAALICSFAIRSNRNLRNIDISRLQKILVERDILPGEILTRKIPAGEPVGTNVDVLIGQLDEDKPLYSYSDMDENEVFREKIPFVEICLLRDKAVPALERALATSSSKKQMLIAKALAFIGSKSAVTVIINRINENLKQGVLPERTETIRHSNHIPPNQAAMPETAYLLNALAMCRDERSVEVWEKVIDILNSTKINLASPLKGIFYYVDAICYGAELTGSRLNIPAFRRLRRNPVFFMQHSDTTLGINCIDERKAMLELEIGTALARSGSKEGFEILINYLDDSRSILAEYAHNSLILIREKDFGKGKDHWQKWLEGIEDLIDPAPVPGRTDG